MFPIMPIQRLDERPDREATLQDMTCDSDGENCQFRQLACRYDHPAAALVARQGTLLSGGFFWSELYQEILGDMHNLFGDTNAVHVSVNSKGYTIDQLIDGETVAEVLDYVQYNPQKNWSYAGNLGDAVRQGRAYLCGRREGILV